MLSSTSALLLSLLAPHAALAHFGLEYPQWRMDTLADTLPPTVSQYVYPCAGVLSNDTGVNRTDWPLDGGSVVLHLHHAWTYIHINLGVQLAEGSTVTNFNVSLTGPTFLNSTGNGTLCIPKLSLPSGFKPVDGQKGSMQVVTLGTSGSALYNCADITFRASATTLAADKCVTNGVQYYVAQSGPAGASTTNGTCSSGTGTGTGTSTTSGSATSSSPAVTSKTGAAVPANGGVDAMLLSSVVGVAALFAYGMV